MTAPLAMPVIESSQVAEVRRAAVGMARSQGFDEAATGRVALVVTEACTNLIKHGTGGEVLLQAVADAPQGHGLEMLALDHGRGMASVAASLRDGHSTAGSLGTGLGAMARAADVLDVYSTPDRGTAVLARLWPQRPSIRQPAQPAPTAQVGGVCVPRPGEAMSGDGWDALLTADGGRIMVADGLGHGPDAAAASAAALSVFRAQPQAGLPDLLTEAHAALRSTRGAALAVAEVSFSQQQVRYAGIGNISGLVWSPASSRNMVSHNGTVGHELYRVQEFVYPWPEGAMLLMFSDGLTSQTRPDGYPGLAQRDPALTAGVLYRDFKRGRDDATVVVMRPWQAMQPL
jgi:anti-sigma regulatory factor (Ser/Thr protein kinase)